MVSKTIDPDINRDIETITNLEHSAKIAQEESQSASEKKNNTLMQLRKKIQSGKSTGDIIKDFVIVRYNQISEAIEKKYQDFQSELRKYIGELVLVVERNEEFHGCTGFGYTPKDHEYSLESTIRLAVIPKEILTLDTVEGNVTIPTHAHASILTRWKHTVNLNNGAIVFHHHADPGEGAGEILQCRNPMNNYRFRDGIERQTLRFEIVIGDNNVIAWFNRECSKLMGYDIILLESFHKAVKLLGHAIPENPMLAEEYRKRRDQAEEVLIQLLAKRSKIEPSDTKGLQDSTDAIRKQLLVMLEFGEHQKIGILSIPELCKQYDVAIPMTA